MQKRLGSIVGSSLNVFCDGLVLLLYFFLLDFIHSLFFKFFKTLKITTFRRKDLSSSAGKKEGEHTCSEDGCLLYCCAV
jgi:hypothetical protein